MAVPISHTRQLIALLRPLRQSTGKPWVARESRHLTASTPLWAGAASAMHLSSPLRPPGEGSFSGVQPWGPCKFPLSNQYRLSRTRSPVTALSVNMHCASLSSLLPAGMLLLLHAAADECGHTAILASCCGQHGRITWAPRGFMDAKVITHSLRPRQLGTIDSVLPERITYRSIAKF